VDLVPTLSAFPFQTPAPVFPLSLKRTPNIRLFIPDVHDVWGETAISGKGLWGMRGDCNGRLHGRLSRLIDWLVSWRLAGWGFSGLGVLTGTWDEAVKPTSLGQVRRDGLCACSRTGWEEAGVGIHNIPMTQPPNFRTAQQPSRPTAHLEDVPRGGV